MKKHPAVKHPSFFLVEKKMNRVRRMNERFLDHIADHVLPSTLLADCAIVFPLLALPAPDSVKLALAVISGSWIQWWALHILQRSSVKADKKHEAKVTADHLALTHLALQMDKALAMLEKEK